MIKLNSHVGLVWVKMINVNVNVGIGQRNPKNWRPESAFPHLWQLFPCLGDLTSRCYMPRHPPQGRRGPVPRPQADSTHSTHWLWQTDDWTRFKGVIGERENRGLEKFDRKWSEEARKKKGSGLWEVLSSTSGLQATLCLTTWGIFWFTLSYAQKNIVTIPDMCPRHHRQCRCQILSLVSKKMLISVFWCENLEVGVFWCWKTWN